MTGSRISASRALRRTVTGLALVCGLAEASSAQVATTPLQGELFIAGRTAVDPPDGEAKDSHAYVTISGPAALRMYRAMQARAEPNACLPGRVKRAGALACALSPDGRRATCDVGIDMMRGALDVGRPC